MGVKAAAATAAAKANQEIDTLQQEKIKLSLKDNSIMLDGAAKVIGADVMATNGVVHVIDSVIVPPTLKAAVAGFKPPIVALAQATDDLKTLVTALTQPGQEAVLKALGGTGPFTVFAPSNAAFNKLKALKNSAGVSLLDHVLKPENAAVLTKILQHHVHVGEVKAAAATTAARANREIDTLQKEKIKLSFKDNSIMLDGAAKVIKADV